MKPVRNLLFTAGMGILLSACLLTKRKQELKTPGANMPTALAMPPKIDSVKKNSPKKFKDFVTANFKSDSGFVSVHYQDEKYFLEIPDAMLGRDILLVNRIEKAAADNRINKGEDGYAGSQIAERVIKFSKSDKQKIFIQVVSYKERSADSTENGMFKNLERSSLLPIVAAFDIKANGAKGTGSLIDVSEFISSDQSIFGFDANVKKSYGLAGPSQRDKSYVISLKAYDQNLELKTINTYAKGEATVTYQLNNSMVLLPETPMKPRYEDKRVGYFTQQYTDFDSPQGVTSRTMASRFKLEPKPEDRERYLKGELVEPVKPIIYYIDPSTPKKWVKYLIAGVNDWQKAFEKAGFKNAIYALEAPVNDKKWSMYDAKNNVIMYMPATMANAMGPHVHDPRSGEILEAHIYWYHDVMKLVHDWYMIQGSPIDPKARKMQFDDELMGQLIRFVGSHEVGHTLGLKHNFKASSTLPVDSLRSKSYLEKNGFSPSIMDYARFNYVAQPQDKITPELLMPRIGVYDKFAIEWAYRWFPEQENLADQTLRLRKWTTQKLKANKQLQFSDSYFGGPNDPRVQTEDLGDDAVKASNYGIENLKYVLRNLPTWTYTPEGDFENISRMQDAVLGQYSRYIGHVNANITNTPTTDRTEDETGSRYEYWPKAKKINALVFLNKQLFTTPRWLVDSKSFKLTGSGTENITKIQDKILTDLVSLGAASRLDHANTHCPAKEKFTFDMLLEELDKGIFNELKTKKPIVHERRVLQRIFVEKLINLQAVNIKDEMLRKDGIAITRNYMSTLVNQMGSALNSSNDKLTRLHLKELHSRIKWALKPESYFVPPAAPTGNPFQMFMR